MTFSTYYKAWQQDIERAETGLRQFVKEEIKNFGSNVASTLLFLNRLDHLKLDCLCLDRRYFDVSQMFVDELKSLKDTCVITNPNLSST